MNFMFSFTWKYRVFDCASFRVSISQMNSKTLTLKQILEERQLMRKKVQEQITENDHNTRYT